MHAIYNSQSRLQNNKNIIKGASLMENNWCFIDMQNLYKGIKERGWKIDWKCFRNYLTERLSVSRAIAFMGYVKEYKWIYNLLEKADFDLEFRHVKVLKNGAIDGGNVDIDVVCCLMDHKSEYNQAILVADDADYHKAIERLYQQNKLKLIISSHLMKDTSELIRRSFDKSLIVSIHTLRNFIEQKKVA